MLKIVDFTTIFIFTDCSGLKGRISQSSLSILCGVLTLSICVDVRRALHTHSLFTFRLACSPVLFLSIQSLLHLCVVIQSLSHRVDNVLLQIQLKKIKNLTDGSLCSAFMNMSHFYTFYLQAGEEISQLNEERQKDESDEARLR